MEEKSFNFATNRIFLFFLPSSNIPKRVNSYELKKVLFLQDIHLTMWKLQSFSATQILREINGREFRSCKTAFFANLGALDFVDSVDFSFQIVQ